MSPPAGSRSPLELADEIASAQVESRKCEAERVTMAMPAQAGIREKLETKAATAAKQLHFGHPS
jgi:hypothetical protein